ncbi:hypothetical protein XMIN_4151 [Xanthomonas citri pv. mangiferaeindicae LMG 941]|nr:hypothetical protein XMIN_4151 [Xanthomonas citri pv. mangiferaeindicae LMG 941]
MVSTVALLTARSCQQRGACAGNAAAWCRYQSSHGLRWLAAQAQEPGGAGRCPQ